MDENIDVLKQRLSKAVEIFNEQKQTIKVREDTITDLKLKNNELKNSYDLSVEENKKLKLELEKLSKEYTKEEFEFYIEKIMEIDEKIYKTKKIIDVEL